jgi:hypothetical protein
MASTSQEEGLAPALSNASNGEGKPLFLTCSIFGFVETSGRRELENGNCD